MRILIIRHADPDYEIDSLTPTGWQEAEMLSERLINESISSFYVSPHGRAKDTASLTLKKLGASAQVCDWLREFPVRINRPDVADSKSIAWDWLPQDWTKVDDFFRYDRWSDTDTMQDGNVGSQFRSVTDSFDALLSEHGYRRNGRIYSVEHSNRETIAFFCHFGLECVLLSHLTNISPMMLWHHFCAAPSSVTSVYTEERREGTAIFRINSFGDTSHLYVHEQKPSFSARFCETWDDPDERHD